ncbi:MAG TPA: hypothetical protein DIC35_01005 [Candidatus Moranbacteria bacterium]|nr:hypothetical protein [Candidatus Moranbacteria bacterium]
MYQRRFIRRHKIRKRTCCFISRESHRFLEKCGFFPN